MAYVGLRLSLQETAIDKYGIVTGKTDWLTALGITLIYNRCSDEHMQEGEQKEVRNGECKCVYVVRSKPEIFAVIIKEKGPLYNLYTPLAIWKASVSVSTEKKGIVPLKSFHLQQAIE